ncbi:MAG: hypothetical protein NUW22_04910 [Acidobacteria bacterium]|nr:hypothetical protein [Acidobacteriota bacterium]
MKAKEYPALVDALDSGILFGLSRADKHASDPLTEAQRDRVAEHVNREVLNAICERFDFEDQHDETP